ncbi:transcriptional repressor LexA [Parachlamydia sp. AcF125]|uniref:transcriptional repressor LexA n=1 Tax=Parachlamydia sp. AcF125 TaxID=2795736 RepID=UPI001BC90A72|nr:transcriptional repressor LexA [Parachlamydia sp. AcF125]MBS4168684.1 LexA repressor [Parachlamydia sp. AcF125]
MKGLTKRQQEILEYIQEFIRLHRFSPSYREIMHKFGYSSLGSVSKHLQVLKRKGLLTSEKKCSRSLKPVENNHPSPCQNEVELAFIGHISAGFPVEIFPKAQKLAVPRYLVQDTEASYILRAQGNSLNDEMISDGDLLIVETGREACSGEWIVALLNEQETFIKRYYPEGQYVRLVGQDSTQSPIMIHLEDLVIQGIVVGLVRLYD